MHGFFFISPRCINLFHGFNILQMFLFLEVIGFPREEDKSEDTNRNFQDAVMSSVIEIIRYLFCKQYNFNILFPSLRGILFECFDCL